MSFLSPMMGRHITETGALADVSGLTDAIELNGLRGIIVDVQDQRFVVDLYTTPARRVAVRAARLLVVPDHWRTTTSTRSFDQLGMLQHFKAPVLDVNVVAPAWQTFLHRDKPCGSAMCKAFWGSAVFDFMISRIREQVATQRGIILYYFSSSRPRCGMVFSDGTKPTQESPWRTSWGCHWWPVVFVPTEDVEILVVYSQAQALTRSRPWRTHVSRLVSLRSATQEVYVETPGPVIEELSDSEVDAADDTSESSDEWYVVP